MSSILVLKGTEELERKLASGSGRTSGHYRDIEAKHSPKRPELQGKRVVRKVPKEISSYVRGGHQYRDIVTESAISQALASLGVPIEPEFPISHRGPSYGSYDWDDETDRKRFGVTEQRQAANILDDPTYEDGDRDSHESRKNSILQGVANQMSSRLRGTPGVARVLGLEDLHPGNIGEFVESESITPTAKKYRHSTIPENIPFKELGETAQHMGLFDEEGNLRPGTRPKGEMRVFDPMWSYIRNDRHGRNTRISDVYGLKEGDADAYEEWIRSKEGRAAQRKGRSREESKANEIWDAYRPFLSDKETRTELPKFAEALPPLSAYDAWAPDERELASISRPKEFQEGGKFHDKETGGIKVPSGFATPELERTGEGNQIKDRLDAHRKTVGEYRNFRSKMELLSSMIKDPEQMRMFEFAGPAGAALGRKIREASTKELPDLPITEPYDENIEGAHPARELGTKHAQGRPTRYGDDIFGFDDYETRWLRKPTMGRNDIFGTKVAPTKPASDMIARLGNLWPPRLNPTIARRVAGAKAGKGYRTLDAEDKARLAELKQPKVPLGMYLKPGGNLADLFGPTNEARRMHEHLVKKVISDNEGWYLSDSEADKMVNGWDDQQKRLAFHKEKVGLDDLGEHSGMLPMWLNAPPDWKPQGLAGQPGEASGIGALSTGPEPVLPSSFNFGTDAIRFPSSSGSPLFG